LLFVLTWKADKKKGATVASPDAAPAEPEPAPLAEEANDGEDDEGQDEGAGRYCLSYIFTTKSLAKIRRRKKKQPPKRKNLLPPPPLQLPNAKVLTSPLSRSA